MKTACYLFVVLPLLSCGLFQRAPDLVDLLPRETEVPGWVVSHRAVINRKKEIGQINEDYARYDPDILVHAEYHYLSDKNKTVSLELLRYGSSLDAFGIFSMERSFRSPIRLMDDESYYSDMACYSRLGNFYVKITGRDLGDERDSILDQYRTVVSKNLKNQAKVEPLPGEAYLLFDNRSTRDLIYYKKGVPDLAGSEDAYVVQRSMLQRKYKVFYMKRSTFGDAVKGFRNILKSAGGSYILSKIGNYEAAIRPLENHEYQYISYYKHWIFGVLDAENMEAGVSTLLALFSEIKARAYVLPDR